MEIHKLPTSPSQINVRDCVRHLPQITNAVREKAEAEHVVRHIKALVAKETTSAASGKDCSGGGGSSNQVVLNLSLRSYFNLLHKYDLEDTHFRRLIETNLSFANERDFQMLYAFLLAETNCCQPNELMEKCVQALAKAVEGDCSSTLAILKALNLLCRKFPELKVAAVRLPEVYHCLQGGQSVREEMLVLFSHCCKQSPEHAFRYFQIIMEFWPWTNRNKFYLLSCIFSTYRLVAFLESTPEHSSENFFSGMRQSLSYKNLFAASQYLVKSLSAQNAQGLLDLAVEILTHGSMKELQNFYSQWFMRIEQKNALFEMLQQKPEVSQFLGDAFGSLDSTENFRLVLIFSMFSRQIFAVSRLHFFKISTELITNCFKLSTEAQLLIFKFLVDNFSNFAIEDGLEFIVAFIREHRAVECAQYRNNILGKMPAVINHISKTFSRLHVIDGTTLESSIIDFFKQLELIIETDIGSDVYQPKIFALKLRDMLLRSLYAQNVQKNAKNCSLAQNQHLGVFLIEQQVFKAAEISARLLKLLDDPLGFDDALALIVELLKQVNYDDFEESTGLCKEFCQRSDVEECMLSFLYAKVAMNAAKLKNQSEEMVANFFEFSLEKLHQSEGPFRADPLAFCKEQHHLFGYVNTINEILLVDAAPLFPRFTILLKFLESISNVVLDMLNLANLRDNNASGTAPSFQDMDESLEFLIQESRYVASEDHAVYRKFLLMSFWLTLKACGDLATTVGCILAATCDNSIEGLSNLEVCLKINVAILTRCRHKGAIEAAGLSIGKLTKSITALAQPESPSFELLQNCLDLLFDDANHVSTTRRGAGFSIMFLHTLKNEEQLERPLLKRSMEKIFKRLEASKPASVGSPSRNCDRVEALVLHYLCVLIKDTELRDAMAKYYNEIIMVAIRQIENPEWTICNAALQLFGALIPKIVGQKQATEFDDSPVWETTEVTYSEMICKLPKTCEYILNYCHEHHQMETSTRSIILFLGFLSKVEIIRKSDVEEPFEPCVDRFRSLMWLLLRHNCEKVRKLAAICFVRLHEFRCDLPSALLGIAKMIFDIKNENFFEGLIFCLNEGVLKLQYDSKYSWNQETFTSFMHNFRMHLTTHFKIRENLKLYTLSKLLDLFILIGFDSQTQIVKELIKVENKDTAIGHDVWLQSVAQISN